MWRISSLNSKGAVISASSRTKASQDGKLDATRTGPVLAAGRPWAHWLQRRRLPDRTVIELGSPRGGAANRPVGPHGDSGSLPTNAGCHRLRDCGNC